MIRGVGKARFAAWLGALALAVQLYLPVHLVHRAESGSGRAPAAIAHHQHSAVHAQAHHDGTPDSQPGTGQDHCPICSMLNSASPMALADGVELHHPGFQGAASPTRPPSYELASAFGASYASRAPPSSLG